MSKISGITLYMQPVQDLSVDDRVSRTQFQYTLEDPNADELNTWAPKMLAKLQQLPELSDVASDQQTQGIQAKLVFDRATASRLGITASTIDQTLYDAYGQRQVSTMFTQLNQYHVVLEVKPNFDRRPLESEQSLHPFRNGGDRVHRGRPSTTPTSPSPFGHRFAVRRHRRRPHRSPLQSGPAHSTTAFPNGGNVPFSAFTQLQTTSVPITIEHQGQFPVITLSSIWLPMLRWAMPSLR